MNEIITYALIIIMGGFLMGLLFYSFFIVLISKDEEKKTEVGESSSPVSSPTEQKNKPSLSPAKVVPLGTVVGKPRSGKRKKGRKAA